MKHHQYFAIDSIEVVIASSTNMRKIENGSFDFAFANNFFEHFNKEEIVKTIREVHRVLKGVGRFLILQPNIRFWFKDYWMFIEQITPLDDRNLTEVLEVKGFNVVECKLRFLLYATKSKLPKSIISLKLYLKFPAVHRILGKQAFVCVIMVMEK
jgi:SAM-dependent methyltransferase